MIIRQASAIIYETAPDGRAPCRIADEILMGYRIDVISDTNATVAHIKTEYGYEGFIFKCAFCEENAKYSALPKLVVRGRFCDVLPIPDHRYPAYITLPKGARVGLFGETEEYYRVLLPNNREGYAKKIYLSTDMPINYKNGYSDFPDSTSEIRNAVIASAKEYLGTPYRWGGKSTSGIDCSGLCFMAYYLNGITIWRDANVDTKYTLKIPYDIVKPADLLYFPGHVGMCLGNGQFIHASSAGGGVCINSLTPGADNYSEYHKIRLECAGRVLK
ncbi:MAG: SH3 domain-containing C40 family peptidase [Oscillospiraceae bacterium]|nr:SH3 domain-containing C40 family peptidase [Oscillospiraceae bacterium]